MNKIEKVEEFLKLISEISKNDILIDSNLVYSNLINLYTPKYNIEKFFPNWINRFKNNKNITVFVQDNWKSFCQFKSFYSKTPRYNKIKMYVPIDKDHIYEGINRLFDFMSSNSVNHMSKVSNNTRIDDVVINADTKEDIDKITKFINSDSYIKEGLISTNPFGFNSDILTYTWDGNLSYNMVVSEWISDYINDLKENNYLNYCSYTGLFTYIKERYSDIFLKGIGINEFIYSRNIKGIDDTMSNLINYHDVTRLLLTALNPNSKIDDLYSSVKVYTNPEYQKELSIRFNKFINNDSKEEITNEDKETIDYIYSKLSKKYGEDKAVEILRKFSLEGNYRYFARENNIRNTMISNNISKESVQKRILDYQVDTLMTSSIETVIKYGISQLKAAIISLKSNDYKMFTNTNNARNDLERLIKPNELDKIIFEINRRNDINENTLNAQYEAFASIVKDNIRRVK